jgi:5S rRNA maturation endonuclease (ribonuclease M5)
MGKTYVDIVKYQIRASLEVNGIVEKPDIVGAIFGQTEGLLGDDLDLRELQKSGRIGRIEVETQVRGGKCVGTVIIPSSLDMVETSILAAALEIVDRVGPCDARIKTERIEDTRNLKRKQVLGRARELLKTMLMSEIPESKELSEMVRDDVKVAEIVNYGPDNLPAGPAIDSSPDIIVVEGRADVLNLLKNGMKNAIAIGGANVGKGIADLCRKKEVTLFLDGDRGGDIILKEMVNATEVEFVARAPIGHEVEELARKEIIQCLRRRIPTEQALSEAASGTGQRGGDRGREPERSSPTRPELNRGRDDRGSGRSGGFERGGRDDRGGRPGFDRGRPSYDGPRDSSPAQAPSAPMMQAPEPMQSAPAPVQEPLPPVPAEVAEPLRASLKELSGSLKARVFDVAMTVTQEVPVREVVLEVGKMDNVHAVALDGIVTQRLLDLAETKAIKYVAGIRLGNVTRRPEGIGIVLAA